MKLRFLILLFFLLAIVSTGVADAEGDYHLIKKIPLGGDGFWDFVTIDSASERLFIGRSNRVMVVDMHTDKLVGEIVSNMRGVHGVAVVPEFNRGFITSGKDDTVRVFDLKTLKETDQVKVGKKPDAIIYDPASKKIFVFNNGGTTATVIDAATGKLVQSLELGGSPEVAVSDGKGHVYANLEDKSEIAVIDTKKLSVTDHWPLSPGTEPTGLAIDVKHRRLFSGCHNKIMAILDADTGKLVANLPIGSGVDGTGFDPQSQNAFSANGDGTLTVIHEANPNSFKVIQNVQTQEGARTMDVDPKTHQIWLVTATLNDAPNDTVEQNRRHKVVAPGSFTALVVGR